jgi:hypothetical protein
MTNVALFTLRLELPARFLDDRGQRAGFVLLIAFLGSYLFIRTSARLMRSPKVPWWPGSVTTGGGLHLHHLVWGIVLMMTAGFLTFVMGTGDPRTEILAAAFGIGMGLTLDEFALWIHLEDVYWSEEGRSSFDAVVVASVLGGLIVFGLTPFDLHNASSISTVITAVVIDVGLAAIAIFKGKPMLGLLGLFVPVFSLVGAIRLASPTSPWARRFYKPDSRRLARSRARWDRIEGRRRLIEDAVAGTPTDELAPEAAGAATTSEPVSSD